MEALEFAALGALEVRRAGAPVALGGSKPRALLSHLLLRANDVVPAARLIDVHWPDADEAKGANVLQVTVGNLRKALEPDRARGAAAARLVSRGTGYVLLADPDEVDVSRFERDAADGRLLLASGSPAEALGMFERALARWRGPALAEVAETEWARADAVRLEELRLVVHEQRIEALAALGRHSDAVVELEALVRLHPLREHLWAQLMTELYRSGRQGDALRAFGAAREVLADEVGLDPGPELVALESAILLQDPGLLAPVAEPAITATGGAAASPRSTGLRPAPAPGSPMHGRDKLVLELQELVASPDVRLVTLTGPGGSGKTRVAQELARSIADAGGAVAWASLAAERDPATVLAVVADALGVPEAAGEQLEATLVRSLGGQQMVLFCDNFEHLRAAATDIASLLSMVAGLTVVVTSRVALGLMAEHEVSVPALPTGSAAEPGPAVDLFVSRVRSLRADVMDEPGAMAKVTELCERLDGLPLAVELVAAGVRSMNLDQMVAAVRGSQWPARHGGGDLPDRQRTMAATVSWSLALLDPAVADTLAALAVFSGTFELTDAQAVLAAVGRSTDELTEHLAELVAHGLILAVDGGGGLTFRILRTVRPVVSEHLSDPDAEQLAAAHARWYLDQVVHQRRSVRDDNVRSAVAHALESGDPGLTDELVSAVLPGWLRASMYADAARAVDVALERCGPTASAELWFRAGVLAIDLVRFDDARRRLEGAVAGFEHDHDWGSAADALSYLGEVEVLTGNIDRADALSRRAIELAAMPEVAGAEHGVSRGMVARYLAGMVSAERADIDAARAAFESHLAALHDGGSPDELAYTLVTLAEVELLGGDRDAAMDYLTESVRHLGDDPTDQLACYRSRLFGMVALVDGDPIEAGVHFCRALDHAGAGSRRMELTWCLDGLGAVAAVLGQPDDAARLFGAADGLRASMGAVIPRVEAELFGGQRAVVRDVLGDARSSRLARLGAHLQLADAVALARQVATGASGQR